MKVRALHNFRDFVNSATVFVGEEVELADEIAQAEIEVGNAEAVETKRPKSAKSEKE